MLRAILLPSSSFPRAPKVFFGVALLLALTVGVSIPGFCAAKEIPIGINSFDPFANPAQFNDQCGWFLSQLSQLGISTVRLRFPWSQIEPTPGAYQWTFIGQVVDSYRQAGIQIVGVLVGPSAWAAQGVAPASEDERQKFAAFAGQAAAHFKGVIRHWEFWPCPNLETSWKPKPNAASYAATLQLANSAIVACDTANLVIGPSLSNCESDFLEDLYSCGIQDRFNLISSQLLVQVGQETFLHDCIGQLERSMQHHERIPKRIWLTDIGLTQPQESQETSQAMESSHAACLTSTLVQSMAEPLVEKIFLSTLQDLPFQGTSLNLGLVRQDKTPREAFVACKTLVEQLAGKSYQGEVYVAPSIKAYLFTGQKQDTVLAIWSTAGRHSVKLPASTSQIRLADIKGNKTWRICSEGSVQIDVDSFPLFVEVDSSILRLSASFYFQNPTANFTRDAQGVNNLTLLNFLAEPIEGPLRFQVPQGWTVEPNGTVLRLSPFQRETFTATFKPPKDCLPGAYPIEAILTVNANDKTKSREISTGFRAFVVEPAEVALTPRMASNTLEISVRLRNSGPQPLSGNLMLGFDPPSAENPFQDKITNLTPQFGITKIFNLQESYLVGSAVKEIFAQFAGLNGDVQKSPPLKISRQPFSSSKPTIDGKLKEWDLTDQISLASERQVVRKEDPALKPAGSSAQVEILWTQDALNIGAQVQDRSPMVNEATGADMTSGDSLELLFDFAGPRGDTESTEKEFHLVLGTGRGGENPQVYEMSRRKALTDSQIAVRSARKGYVLEASIPLTQFENFRPAPGEVFSMDVLLNDRDGVKENSTRTTLSWAREPSKTSKSSNWGLGIIVASGTGKK